MTTFDLRIQQLTIDELFAAAAAEPVHIITKSGTTFVLETADEFEREVAQLGQSQDFMAFLAQRGQETGGISLEAALKRQEQSEQDSHGE